MRRAARAIGDLLPAFVSALSAIALSGACAARGPVSAAATSPVTSGPPNILVAISDDQSYPHAGAYGARGVRTPAFDRVAREGVLFRNAFHASPGCSPSRASLLTGRHTWQLEQAGTHSSIFPTKYVTYPDRLARAGYVVGHTGKGWGPGNFEAGGRPHNPAGPDFTGATMDAPHGVSREDYAANFRAFLDARPRDRPFAFWFGAHEPHRLYDEGAGLRSGKAPSDAEVPPFLPDRPEIRSDILDYQFEIEWFDRHLGAMLDALDKRGELARTIVLVTSDNGMSFPRAKANCYEYGIHAPLAIRWPERIPGGRVVDDIVGFVDVAPTLLQAAGLPANGMTGRSFLGTLTAATAGLVDATRTRAYAARERHSHARAGNLGYPVRAMRTPEWLLVRNFRPDRWPAGDPASERGDRYGYYDIDDGASKRFMWERREDPGVAPFFQLAVARRPALELYDVRADPGNLRNLADDPLHADVLRALAAELEATLRATGDARVLDGGEVWETYPRHGKMRALPP